jgi:hypothetical protein
MFGNVGKKSFILYFSQATLFLMRRNNIIPKFKQHELLVVDI